MLRNLRIVVMLPLIILILVASGAPRTWYANAANAANAQDQISGTDLKPQLCDDLRRRGSGFEQLANACQYAVAAPHTLPDFVCTETVKRYLSPKDKPEIITAELSIEKTRSHYAAVTVNGKTKPGYEKTGDVLFEELVGSTGEFAMLFNVFDSSSHAEFTPPVEAVLGRTRLKRYDFRVKRENNVGWTWFFVDNAISPGYHGSIFVDSTTGNIFRLVLQVSPDELDPQTPVSEATTTIDYGDVSIAGAGTHRVPVRGENISCFRILSACTRAQLTFGNFHKFGSTIRLLPGP